MLEHQKDMLKQTNQAAIDFSIKTIWSLFLINGAAATALLSTKITSFYFSATFFALGAITAVLAFGVSYVYCLLLAETWRPGNNLKDPGEKIFLFDFFIFKKSMSENDINKARIIPILFTIASVLLFLVGIVLCWSAIRCLNT